MPCHLQIWDQIGRFDKRRFLAHRERIKRKTLEARRLHHRQRAAKSNQTDEPNSTLAWAAYDSKNPDDGHFLTCFRTPFAD